MPLRVRVIVIFFFPQRGIARVNGSPTDQVINILYSCFPLQMLDACSDEGRSAGSIPAVLTVRHWSLGSPSCGPDCEKVLGSAWRCGSVSPAAPAVTHNRGIFTKELCVVSEGQEQWRLLTLMLLETAEKQHTAVWCHQYEDHCSDL